MPRSKIVSIMPGIDSVAPERTLTSSGRGPRPNVREVCASSQLIRSSTSSQIASIVAAGSARYRTPTSVVMQNAGGTGKSCRRIASMPWPLLPRISRGMIRVAVQQHHGLVFGGAFEGDCASCETSRGAPPRWFSSVGRANVGTPAMFPHGSADTAGSALLSSDPPR